MRPISANSLDFGPMVQEISFEDISYLELFGGAKLFEQIWQSPAS